MLVYAVRRVVFITENEVWGGSAGRVTDLISALALTEGFCVQAQLWAPHWARSLPKKIFMLCKIHLFFF